MAEAEEETVNKQPVSERTRSQAVKEMNRRRAEERKRTEDSLKAAYQQISGEAAMKDIVARAQSFAAYHNKIAKDRVGMRPVGTNPDGTTRYEEYTLTAEERLSNLDNAAGIEELLGYIERKLEV